MNCRPESITALVDDELTAQESAELDAHLASCARCREQAAFERSLKEDLAKVPEAAMSPGLEHRVRQMHVGRRARPLRWIALLAASLVLLLLWNHDSATLIAWELAYDHGHCFDRPRPPAEIWTSEPAVLRAALAGQGIFVPPLPDQVEGLRLLGARQCPLLDRRVTHIYYADEARRQISLYGIPGPLEMEGHRALKAWGRSVRLVRTPTRVIAVVGQDETLVASFERVLTLEESHAMASPPTPDPSSSTLP